MNKNNKLERKKEMKYLTRATDLTFESESFKNGMMTETGVLSPAFPRT